MSLQGQRGEDIRATLALSQAEARNGTTRTLNLPGSRRISVPIAAGTPNGQVIRLVGQGEPSYYGGPAGDLILTIAVAQEQFNNRPYSMAGMDDPDRPTEFVTPLPPSTGPSSPTYGSNFSAQQQTYLPPPPAQYTNPSNYVGIRSPMQPPAQAPAPQPPVARRRLSPGVTAIIAALVLLLIGGCVLILYAAVYVPNKQHADATATVQTQLTGTAVAHVTGTAQANATSTAQAIVTGTAQANATSTAIAGATATAIALQNMYTTATSGNPALNDPLTGNDANNWDENKAVGGGGCAFSGGAYHATMPQKGFYFTCFAQAPGDTYTNFAFQVQLKIVNGDDGGIVFRGDSAHYKFYRFYINHNGSYCIDLAQDINHVKQFFCNSSPVINTNFNQTNLLTVIAQGSNIYMYINKQYVASLSDKTYGSGQIGVFVGDETNATDVAFNNAQLWIL